MLGSIIALQLVAFVLRWKLCFLVLQGCRFLLIKIVVTINNIRTCVMEVVERQIIYSKRKSA